VFLYGAALSNPNLHAHMDLPLAIVGGPAGSGGQHWVETSNTPMSNVLLTLLDRVDVPVSSIGDSTGPVVVGPANV
jgi:hypothetical protein